MRLIVVAADCSEERLLNKAFTEYTAGMECLLPSHNHTPSSVMLVFILKIEVSDRFLSTNKTLLTVLLLHKIYASDYRKHSQLGLFLKSLI